MKRDETVLGRCFLFQDRRAQGGLPQAHVGRWWGKYGGEWEFLQGGVPTVLDNDMVAGTAAIRLTLAQGMLAQMPHRSPPTDVYGGQERDGALQNKNI